MRDRPDVDSRVRQYFVGKTLELRAAASQAVCEHPGLIGSHREAVQRLYLSSVVPARYSVGRGMVYSSFDRSKEADIVVWDSDNYPSLPLSDHAFFFAESVRVVLETKTRWSDAEFRDVKEKCAAVNSLLLVQPESSLPEEVDHLREQLAAFMSGQVHGGTLLTRPHIGTAAIFLQGGQAFLRSLDTINLDEVEDGWPDLMLFLETGVVVAKTFTVIEGAWMGGEGHLHVFQHGDDGLLAFTAGLLSLIGERSAKIEAPLFLLHYTPSVLAAEPIDIEFRVTRPVPQRRPFLADP